MYVVGTGGTLTLAGSDTYTGGTTVTGGTLVVASANALGGGVLAVAAGGAVQVAADVSVASQPVNNGSFVVNAGHTFSVGTYGFNQSAGTLAVNGSLVLQGGTFYDLGGTITGGPVSFNNGSGTVTFGPAAKTGTFAFTGSYVEAAVGGTTSAVNVPSGATVTAQSTVGNTYLNVAAPANYGSLTVTSANGYSSSLYVAGSSFANHGTVTLAAAGTPSGPASVSSGFAVNAADGTLNVNTSATLSSQLANLGTLNIAAGETLSAGTYGFNQAGGTLAVNGSLVLQGGTFYDLGGTITGTPITFNNGSGTVTFGPAAPAARFAFTGSYVEAAVGGTTAAVNIPSGATVTAQSTVGNTYLNVAAPANYGSLTVTSASGYTSSLYVSGSSFVNHGVITLAAAGTPSGPASVSSGFATNAADGTLNVNTSATLSSQLANLGTLNIATGATLSAGTYGFNQAGGTLAVNGSLVLQGGTFYDLGGTITGTPITFNNGSGTVTFGSAAPSATFAFTGSYVEAAVGGTTSAVNVPSGATVTAQSTVGNTYLNVAAPANYGSLTVTSANGYTSSLYVAGSSFANHGVITLAAAGTPSGPASVSSGFAVNAADGTLNVNTSATLSSQLANLGTLNIATGATLSAGTYGFNQAGGTLAVNGSLVLQGGTFYDLGGTITGTPITFNNGSGTVTFGPAAPAAQFAFTGSYVEAAVGGTTSAVNVPSGVTVTAQSTVGNTYLNVAAPANYGSLTVTSANGYTSSLYVAGSSFANHGTVTLAAAGTPSGPASVSSGFAVNAADGTLNVNTSATLSGPLATAGAVNVAAGATLTTPTGSAGLNVSGGAVTLAASPTAPATLATRGVYWPAASTATTAAIATTAGATAATAGRVDLGGTAAAPFDVENPAATLTVSANVTDGGVSKLGPGTLVLTGPNTYAGTTAVAAGTLTLAAGSSLASSLVTVAAGATFNDFGSAPTASIQSQGTVNFPAGNGATPTVVRLTSLSVAAGQTATIAAPASPAGRTLLRVNSLTLAGSPGNWQSTLDLTGNDLIVANPSLATVTSQAAQGFAGGTWAGTGGILSSTAAADPAHLTAVGVIQNATTIGGSTQIYQTFDGLVVAASDILVRYTYYGDTNLDGSVTAADYTRIDAGFVMHLTGWQNGDFNYDGTVDGTDYALMDNAFNQQSGGIAAPAAVVAAPAATAAVPEPASLAAIVLVGLAVGRSARRSRRSATR